MFVLELGKSAVLKSWRGEDYLLTANPERGRLLWRDGCNRPLPTQRRPPCS